MVVVQVQPVLLLVSVRQYKATVPELSLTVKVVNVTVRLVAVVGRAKALMTGALVSLKVATTVGAAVTLAMI